MPTAEELRNRCAHGTSFVKKKKFWPTHAMAQEWQMRHEVSKLAS